MAETVVGTPLGAMAFVEGGDGRPVLFVHGSPGGSDQGILMGRFLVESGYRVIAPSWPGYLGTPLHEANGSAAATADMLLGLMDALSVESFGVLCWSGVARRATTSRPPTPNGCDPSWLAPRSAVPTRSPPAWPASRAAS